MIVYHSTRFVMVAAIALAAIPPLRPHLRAAEPLAHLDAHAFPAVGSSAPRIVRVEWNRFYDTAGLATILEEMHRAFPNLTRLYSIGRSAGGRELWCLEVTAFDRGNPHRKPGMYIDGNIHGNEVQGGEAVAYTAWYLCHQYGRLPKVTELLDRTVFYLIPTINPDGRDRWFYQAQTASSSRSGIVPLDNDRDGALDEDDVDDLDGDGAITQMWIHDPFGRWKKHPDYPNSVMVPVSGEERGEFSPLGSEGLDNDGDGRVNEDPVGGYDMNRNWAWDWQPSFIQYGAMEFPFSLPETRAISRFIVDHPNIAGFQSYHNAGGMILRSPGREGGIIRPADDQVLQTVAQRGEKILPFYRSLVIWKDLYTVWGGEIDWLYAGRGILGFSNELWTRRNLNKGTADPNREEDAAFLEHVLIEDGVVPWHNFQHPIYGEILIGGTRKEWGRTPPSFLLEEECHRNMAFTLYHAAQMPEIRIANLEVTELAADLYRVWITIENRRLFPTRSNQDVQNHITAPDLVTLRGDQVRVLSSGIVTDRFFKEVSPVQVRPERVEVNAIAGRNAARVQFIVQGRGGFEVAVDSVKGGRVVEERVLP